MVAPSIAEDRDFSGNDTGATSFAAPVVSGIVALMRQHKPEATPGEIRQAFLASAREIAGVDRGMQGAGVVDVTPALEALDAIA